MKTITNKTQRPVAVPLPRGKKLHLGPGKTGQIASNDADHPALAKLVAEGTLELLDEGARSADGGSGGKAGGGPAHGHAWGAGKRRSGDR